ncbi:uncharacterized protein LOC144100479 [Amblyomma americanum]
MKPNPASSCEIPASRVDALPLQSLGGRKNQREDLGGASYQTPHKRTQLLRCHGGNRQRHRASCVTSPHVSVSDLAWMISATETALQGGVFRSSPVRRISPVYMLWQ